MANSHSSMVRVYEFKNIHAQLEDHGNLILGDGPGSRFTDRYHPFPFGLTENDYSLEERMSRRFRKSHSLIAQLMLQLGYAGMLWYLLCVAGLCLACWRVYRVTADPALKTVALSLLAFLPALVYMSWNSKANMLLGLLLGMVGAAHHWEVGRDSLLPGLRETPAPK